MDTRLKNNHKVRNIIVVLGLIVFTIVTMCFCPAISQDAEKYIEQMRSEVEDELEINGDLLQSIYDGCYVLYLEMMQHQSNVTASDIYLETSYRGTDAEAESHVEELKDYTDSKISYRSREFENYRSQIDYCIFLNDGECEKNTSQPLEKIDNLTKEEEHELVEYYSDYFKIQFDKNGIFTVEPIYSEYVQADSS